MIKVALPNGKSIEFEKSALRLGGASRRLLNIYREFSERAGSKAAREYIQEVRPLITDVRGLRKAISQYYRKKPLRKKVY